LHFRPTGSSWLNLVERWFSELTTKKIRRGSHLSVRALQHDIRNWIDTWNDDSRPSRCGSRPRTRSSTPQADIPSESLARDTRGPSLAALTTRGPFWLRRRLAVWQSHISPANSDPNAVPPICLGSELQSPAV
jgi:hypothetical protein